MDRARKLLTAGEWLWLLAWGVASSVWCLTSAGQLGATYDEPFYLRAGLERWRTGSRHDLLGAGTMPLPAEVQTLPLYLGERWQGTPLDLDGDFEKWLSWARAGTLVFWWLLLWYGWRAGRRLAGPWGGALAVALLACEPSLLAHAGLATTDVALSACLLALVYHFRDGREAGWPRRVGLPAVWFAAAFLSKASGLIFGPLCLVAVELERLTRAGWSQRLAPAVRDLAAIVLCGLGLALAYSATARQPFRDLTPGRDGIPAGPAGAALLRLAEHAHSPEAVYKATLFQVHHNKSFDSGVYLLGQPLDGPVWYYFPLILCIKLSLPLLALPAVVAALRPRALLNWACAAALALLAASATFRVQIGVRFVLPLVALAVVGLAAAAVEAARRGAGGWRRVAGTTAAVGAVLWAAWGATAAWPDGLRYTNECWGGREEGYRQVSDSNYDWGQGLKELARWQRCQGVPDLEVWYFGTDPALKTLAVHEIPLHVFAGQGPEGMLSQVRGHYLAASLSWVYGGHKCSLDAARFLRRYRPVARTSTFLIYDFTHVPESN